MKRRNTLTMLAPRSSSRCLSGDATPYRMTGVLLRSRPLHGDISYTGLFSQEPSQKRSISTIRVHTVSFVVDSNHNLAHESARKGHQGLLNGYRGTSLIRNRPPLGPYSRSMPRVLQWSYGVGQFLMREVPLYTVDV